MAVTIPRSAPAADSRKENAELDPSGHILRGGGWGGGQMSTPLLMHTELE